MKKIINNSANAFIYLISIERDNDPQNPRTEWDNMGTLSLPNRRYTLTDKNAIDDIEELKCYLGVETDKGVLQYYGYENHKFKGVFIGVDFYNYGGGNITIKETQNFEDADGFLYVDKTTILKEFGGKNLTKDKKEQALKILRGELETFNQYIEGDVFGYSIEAIEKTDYPNFEELEEDDQTTLINDIGEHIYSCWGYYYEDEEALYKDLEKEFNGFIEYHEKENKKRIEDKALQMVIDTKIASKQLEIPIEPSNKEFNVLLVKTLFPTVLD